jgi:hypothetical protein
MGNRGAGRSRSRAIAGAIALFVGIITAAAHAGAAWISVPLKIDYMVLDAAIRQRLYTAPGGGAEFWRGSGGCGYFTAHHPRFGRDGSAIRLETGANLSLALDVAGECLNAAQWSGIIQADSAPYIEGFALKFRVTDINFLNPDRTPGPLGGRAFDLAKGNLIPRLDTFSYDLTPYVRQLNGALDSASAADAEMRAALASLRLGPQVSAEDDGAGLTLEFAAPDRLLSPPRSDGAPLTPAEMAAWRTALRNADQFLETASAQINDFLIGELRSELMLVIGDARARIARAENNPPPGADPLPLIRPDWEQLRAIVATAAHRGNFGPQTARVLSLAAIGDAIFALDQRQPALGSRIAREGLGRMAGGIEPQPSAPPARRAPL